MRKKINKGTEALLATVSAVALTQASSILVVGIAGYATYYWIKKFIK